MYSFRAKNTRLLWRRIHTCIEASMCVGWQTYYNRPKRIEKIGHITEGVQNQHVRFSTNISLLGSYCLPPEEEEALQIASITSESNFNTHDSLAVVWRTKTPMRVWSDFVFGRSSQMLNPWVQPCRRILYSLDAKDFCCEGLAISNFTHEKDGEL